MKTAETLRLVLRDPARAVRLRPEIALIPLVFVLVVGGWEGIVRGWGVSQLILPAPSSIVFALYQGFANGLLWYGFLVTLQEIILGYLLAAASAFLLGAVISQMRVVEATLYPYIVAFQTLPKIAIAPILLIWVGFGIASKVVIAALVAFFPILVNTIVGLKATSPDKIDLMRSLAASRWKIFRLVQLPEALPYIFAGLNVGIVLAVLGAIVGEFVGATAGLGYLILQMNYDMDISGMFAVLAILGVMGIAFHLLVGGIRRRVIFWQKDNTGNP
ncbi:MAG: ABC transporter permease [Nitrospinota bacterium]